PTARRVSSIASRLPGTNRLGFQPSLALSERKRPRPICLDKGLGGLNRTEQCAQGQGKKQNPQQSLRWLTHIILLEGP
ncbi:MAG: hypothetical protein ABW095_02340, partial [Candidatus Thiodiazotropha sp.]